MAKNVQHRVWIHSEIRGEMAPSLRVGPNRQKLREEAESGPTAIKTTDKWDIRSE